MITLRDEIEIYATPEQIFEWFSQFDANYLEWHPDHVSCEFLEGTFCQEGSIVYTEEYLHGELHKLKMRITRYQTNSLIEYKILGTKSWGSFAVEPKGKKSSFIAELHFGLGVSLLDKIIDPILERLLSFQLDAFRTHMKEEGQNLKTILQMDGANGVVKLL
jgi:hypothetical protein